MLARRVSAEGRTRAYLGGRSATAADLRDVGGALLSLLRPARAPQAHARLGAAGDPGRLLRRRRMPRGCRRSAPPTPASGSCGRARGARGPRRRARPRAGPARVGAAGDRRRRAERGRGGRRWPPSASGCATSRRCSPPRPAGVEALTGDGEGAGDEGATAALAGAARALESVRGVDAALDALADRVAALAVEADDLATELRALRRGRRGDARPAGRGRGAPGAAGPAQAQARRHAGRGARPRRGVPPPPRRARRRRGGARGRRRPRSPRRARSCERAPRELRTARDGRRRRAGRTPCASGWPRWRWTARPSRPR